MHYASHILMHCIVLWCAINGGETARSAVSPEILANFAKNVASVISPAILGEIQTRNNRSSFESNLAEQPIGPNPDPDSSSTLDNAVEKTSNVHTYYDPRYSSYNRLYEDASVGTLEGSRASGRFGGFLRDESYPRQERPSFYDRSYGLPSSDDNFEETQGPVHADIADIGLQSSIGNIAESPSNRYSAYHGVGHGPSPEAKPQPGFPGFGPYGHFHGHYHHQPPYHNHYGNGGAPADEAAPEENARIERNDTNRRGYGPPFGDYGYHHPYPSFPYGGYNDYDPFYGPHRRGENDSAANGRYGPYDGPDFYGPRDGPYGGYGYGYGHNGNRNNGEGGGSSRQTEEPAGDGDQANNGTKNGYPGQYGPPLYKPFLGGFPPYDHHFHFKGGPAVGVGHVGYPIFADPYLIGFPFHYPYGAPYYGKRGKYLPPNGKPADSGEQTEAPAGELTENAEPQRITALNVEEAAPASTSNRYKTSSAALRKSLKRLGLINIDKI